MQKLIQKAKVEECYFLLTIIYCEFNVSGNLIGLSWKRDIYGRMRISIKGIQCPRDTV